ncbi:MAG: RES family NAD+ phosphorylase [Isosphaerales bacterium]
MRTTEGAGKSVGRSRNASAYFGFLPSGWRILTIARRSRSSQGMTMPDARQRRSPSRVGIHYTRQGKRTLYLGKWILSGLESQAGPHPAAPTSKGLPPLSREDTLAARELDLGRRGLSPNGWTAMQHPESDRLRRALERCASRAVRWSGVVYRSASPHYANKDDLLTGVGSKTAGARWNPPKSFPTVYSSLDPHTALDEVLAHFRYFKLPIESAMPRVMVSVSVRLGTVLDLTDWKTRSALQVSERRMLDEPWREEQNANREALIQALGRLGHELGWEGLLVPSAARRGGMNLIVFPANLSRRSFLEIINVGHLPRRE